jgi:DNA-binding transcriptional MerR regulator
MPPPKNALNAFPADEFAAITGLSLHMVNYLSDHEFLRPTFGNPFGTRGKVRYYSYRDLVVGRLIQRLRLGGVQLKKIKAALQALARDPVFIRSEDDLQERLRWLVTDGSSIHFRSQDGFLDELGAKGQRSFAFIVDIEQLTTEVRALVPPKKRKHFELGSYQLRIGRRSRALAKLNARNK